MSDIGPPRGAGPLARSEARLAWGLLTPTIIAVSLVVILPLLAIFWISVKPVSLSDLRAPEMVVREDLRGRPAEAGDEAILRYRLRNSSPSSEITGVRMEDTWPDGLTLAGDLDPRCEIAQGRLSCDLGDWEGGYRETLNIPVVTEQTYFDAGRDVDDDPVQIDGKVSFVLTNGEFTFKNFVSVFDGGEFWSVLGVTLFYTIFGTLGAMIMGLFASMLLNHSFKGQGILRGLYLFPYVAPVIAVAFAWILLFDPFSGSANALLIQMGVTDGAINFFGERPLALIMVTLFEIWRYFPLSFLFILARMQSIPTDMYVGVVPFALHLDL